MLNLLILIEFLGFFIWVLILILDKYNYEMRLMKKEIIDKKISEAKKKAAGQLMYSNYPYEGGEPVKPIAE